MSGAAGYEERTSATGDDFLRAVDPDVPGCIILDVTLPDQSGLDIQVALAERAVNGKKSVFEYLSFIDNSWSISYRIVKVPPALMVCNEDSPVGNRNARTMSKSRTL